LSRIAIANHRFIKVNKSNKNEVGRGKGCKNGRKIRENGWQIFFFEVFADFMFTNVGELCYNVPHRKSRDSFKR
jgi:hypothetical protein